MENPSIFQSESAQEVGTISMGLFRLHYSVLFQMAEACISRISVFPMYIPMYFSHLRILITLAFTYICTAVPQGIYK